MADTAMQIKRHIEVLEEFEQKYTEYLVARQHRQIEDRSEWSSGEWAERERELRVLAPRAEAAIGASGVEGYADLPSVILAFKDWVGFTVDARDDDLQREILRLIPSQMTGLQMRLEEAEEASREKGRGLRKAFADHQPHWKRWLREPNPWALVFAAAVLTVAASLVTAWILAA